MKIISISALPITKEKHPVLVDYGYSTDIAKEYQKRRKVALDAHFNRNW
jgi:hypothetical protein